MRFSFDQFTLDTDRFELRRAGEVLAAEPQVIELLALLLENRGRLMSRDEINEIVWRNPGFASFSAPLADITGSFAMTGPGWS